MYKRCSRGSFNADDTQTAPDCRHTSSMWAHAWMFLHFRCFLVTESNGFWSLLIWKAFLRQDADLCMVDHGWWLWPWGDWDAATPCWGAEVTHAKPPFLSQTTIFLSEITTPGVTTASREYDNYLGGSSQGSWWWGRDPHRPTSCDASPWPAVRPRLSTLELWKTREVCCFFFFFFTPLVHRYSD